MGTERNKDAILGTGTFLFYANLILQLGWKESFFLFSLLYFEMKKNVRKN
jgi:hypothetical protein